MNSAAGAGQGEQGAGHLLDVLATGIDEGADQALHIDFPSSVLMTPRLVGGLGHARDGVAHAHHPRSGRPSGIQQAVLQDSPHSELGRFLPAVSSTVRVGLGGGQLALIDAGVAVHQGLEVSHAGGGHQQAGTGLAGMALRRVPPLRSPRRTPAVRRRGADGPAALLCVAAAAMDVDPEWPPRRP